MIELPERLASVFNLIPDSTVRVIDVGSDHGKMALACLQSEKAKRVVCTDIHKEPAERTRRCLADYNYSDKSEVYQADGLDGVALENNDTVVIAGMGGNTIVDILTRVLDVTTPDTLKNVTWCLQPQKSIERLRYFLADNGFEIEDEIISIDRDIYYQILKVKYSGIKYCLTDIEAYYGPVLYAKSANDSEIRKFYEHLTSIYEIRARGDEAIKKMLENKEMRQ